jgi:crotonobetainyl-CoA:carnitine CoA-transferase CaiB-like acyl-CoA transferase
VGSVRRVKGDTMLITIVSEVIGSKTAAERETITQEYDLVLGRIQTPMEVANDPQAWENDFFTELEYAPGVRFKTINSPVKFSQTPATVRSLAPELGQHTEEILLDLGYTWDDMAEFKNQGIIM